jgi:hypothetical protein
MGTVRYELLGPLVVRRAGIRRNLGPEQQQRILAALLLKANQAVSPAELVTAGWESEPPANARELVAGYIDALRELVDPHRIPGTGELLITLGDGKYVLCVTPTESDLSEFNLYVAEAERLSAEGKHQEAADKVRTALALWHGTPLEGLEGRPFDEARSRLLEARRKAEQTLHDLEAKLAYRHLPGLPSSGQALPALRAWSPAPAPQARPSRGSAKLVVLKLLGAATPLVTFGFGGWILMGVVAFRQRSVALGLSAAGYLAAMLSFFFLVIEPDRPEFTDRDFVFTLIHLLAAAACSVQAAVVIGRPPRSNPQQPPYLQQPHQLPYAQQPPVYPPQPAYPPPAYQPPVLSADVVLRNNARRIAANDPALAQALKIGRPDLPRHFDDGGLIDLNGAPAALLGTLPGVTGQQAAAIVLSRTQYGRFRAVDELWTRGLLPVHLAPQLTDLLVILDVQDA